MIPALASENGEKAIVFVADTHPLRSRALAAFLSGWSATAGPPIVEVDLLYEPPLPPEKCRTNERSLALLSVGGLRLVDSEFDSLLLSLRRRLGSPRFAIVSDREDAREIILAHEAGAIGFIPTTLEPRVVQGIIALLLEGGTYFPVSALARSRGRRRPESGIAESRSRSQL